MKRTLLLLLFLSLSFWLWSQSFSFRDPAFVAGLAPSGAAAAAETWYPTNIAGCGLWLSADEPRLVGTADGTLIADWRDQSGWGLVFTQATAARRPIFTNNAINSKPSLILTNGVGFYTPDMDITTNVVGTNEMTIFTVFRMLPGYDNQRLYYWNGGGTNLLELIVNSGAITFRHSAGGLGETAEVLSGITNNVAMLVDVALSAADNVSIFTNGASLIEDPGETGAMTNGALEAFNIPSSSGGTYNIRGEIMEYIFYNRCLTSNEMVRVRTNLNSKYLIYTPHAWE